MLGSLAHCFKGLQESSKNVGEAKPVYRDDLNRKPIHETDQDLRHKEGLKPICRRNNLNTTKKKANKVVRFADDHTKTKPPSKEEVSKPRNNKSVRFHVVEEREEVIRVKIKMTKLEAQRLLSKRTQNDGVLELQYVADLIATSPVQIATLVVGCYKKNDKGRCY